MISGETKVRIQMCTTIWNVIMNTLIVREQLTLELRFAMVCMITRGVQMAQARSCSFVQKLKLLRIMSRYVNYFISRAHLLNATVDLKLLRVRAAWSNVPIVATQLPNVARLNSNLCRGYVYYIKETA